MKRKKEEKKREKEKHQNRSGGGKKKKERQKETPVNEEIIPFLEMLRACETQTSSVRAGVAKT